MPNLIIDVKEPDTIASQFPDCKIRNLGKNSGDLYTQLSNGILIVERKTPDDFCNSIAPKEDSTHNVFDQCEHIAALARFAFLVIDGKFYFKNGKLLSTRQGFGFAETGWRQVSIEAALTKVGLLGVTVVRDFMGRDSYADCIKSLINMCEQVDSPHANHKARSQNGLDEATQAKLDFIAAFPGVGSDRAINLINAFPQYSINELLYWMKDPSTSTVHVPLWGSKTFELIRQFLGEENESSVQAQSEK